MKKNTGIDPIRQNNYPKWYQEIIKSAKLAENAPVKGCMTIKPFGYNLWENIQEFLNKILKKSKHDNAYFPLLIPKSFFQKEINHIKGFGKECAIVTHSKLSLNQKEELIETSKLDESFIIRPTSETIIGTILSKWIFSYRDLPLLINQWANVIRWEMRTRIFLRTSEFLWQEGHTIHTTSKEAILESNCIIKIYKKFIINYLSIPIIEGIKSQIDSFPGAQITYCLEAMMQDGKALQMATSHLLGQNFSKANNIIFYNKKGIQNLAWTTSWGVSTRLIGGIIMVHSDDNGIQLPPMISPIHIIICPIIKDKLDKNSILKYCNYIQTKLLNIKYQGQELKIHISNTSANTKKNYNIWDSIKKGIPLFIEIGMREVANKYLIIVQRHLGPKYKIKLTEKNLERISLLLKKIQSYLYHRAKTITNKNSFFVPSMINAYKFYNIPKQKGFIYLPLEKENTINEKQIQNDLKVTIRCICPQSFLSGDHQSPRLFRSALFAKSY